MPKVGGSPQRGIVPLRPQKEGQAEASGLSEPSFDFALIQIIDCVVKPLNRTWQFDNLSSPYWRFYHMAQEGASVIHLSREIPLETGCYYLIPPSTDFSTGRKNDQEQLYIHFVAGNFYDSYQPGIYKIPAFPEGDSALRDIRRKCAGRGSAQSRELILCTMLLAYALSRLPEKEARMQTFDRRILDAIGFLRKNLAFPISVSMLANSQKMSRTAFIRAFKKETGSTPHDFFRSYKIERARHLLEFTDLTIDNIAAKVGYEDRFHFSRIFKKQWGVAPAECRKAFREGKRLSSDFRLL